METEDNSASKSRVEKPPNTPDMSARETEDMVNFMLRDSPLPDTERSDEKLPEDGESHKLPEEDNSEKLPEGGDKKLSEEAPAGKLVSLCTEEVLFLALNLIKYHIFPLDSQNPGNTVEMVQDVPEKAISEVQASSS